jgi:hypothetical protein
MDNMRMRKGIANFDVLFDLYVHKDDHPDWTEAISLYQSFILSMRNRNYLRDAEINNSQWPVNQFAQVWRCKLRRKKVSLIIFI